MTETSQERRESLLRKVRGLVAKADATPFEAEADIFRAKAQEFMDRYMIEEWELAQQTGDTSALRAVRQDLDISWWYNEEDDIAQALSTLFFTLAPHCNVACAWKHARPTGGGLVIPCYGTEQDIAFLDLLFTSLMTQMLAKFKPVYDSTLSLGQNVARAKEVGMKYTDIAIWCGHPEWRVPNGTGGYKTDDKGKMLREYKKYARITGISVNTVNPKTYIRSYASGFVGAIAERLRRPEELTGSMALAIRDAMDTARDAMFDEFPDMAKSSGLVRSRRAYDYAGAARGAKAGNDANIVSRGAGLKQQKEIG